MSYEQQISKINERYMILVEQSKSITENKLKHTQLLTELKLKFSNSYSECINDLNLIITHIENTKISASIKDNENEDTEDSPAAAIPKILWPNQSKIWTHDSSLKKSTFTCDTLLDKVFSVRIKIIKGGIGALTLGVSSTELDTGKRYLGGDLGPGNWGIAGSKVLGEEGNWRYDSLPFNLNDILTISGNNGVIRYTVNDQDNSSYQYDMKTTNLYLAASLNEGDIMEILD